MIPHSESKRFFFTASTTTMSDRIELKQISNRPEFDTQTPISLFLQIKRDQPNALLFESAEVDGRWGRYSVIACDFLLTLSCREAKLHLDIADERLVALAELEGKPFLEGVRAVTQRLEVQGPSDQPPITRALYGYFGYEMAALFQPKLAETINVHDAEAILVLPGTIYVFDHLYNHLTQLSLSDVRQLTDAPLEPRGKVHTGEISRRPDRENYERSVARVREMLRQGEAIQIVGATQSSASFEGDSFELYRRMRSLNPSPYMFYMSFPDIRLFGSSPEVMVRCTDGLLQLSPIAGTRRRGGNEVEDARLAAELLQDPKERAEHVMLVDLGRNDLGRVARADTVKVERLMEIERFSHVMHMTSRVTASLENGKDGIDILSATFPAGTVSGAPKVRAMEIINEIEEVPRGPYAGCVGWLGLDSDSVHLDMGITIRSMWERDGRIFWQSGAGLVYDSDPEKEWQECCNKGKIMETVLSMLSENF